MAFEIASMLRDQSVISAEATDEIIFENYSAAVDRGISKVEQSDQILYKFY